MAAGLAPAGAVVAAAGHLLASHESLVCLPAHYCRSHAAASAPHYQLLDTQDNAEGGRAAGVGEGGSAADDCPAFEYPASPPLDLARQTLATLLEGQPLVEGQLLVVDAVHHLKRQGVTMAF